MHREDEPISTFIADDHPVFRKGLRTIIEGDGRLLLVGEAADGVEALEGIQSKQPRVAILDLNMPRMTGFEVAEAVIRQRLPVGIIFLTMYDDEPFLEKALRLGVNGYLLKDTASADIVQCVLAVTRGDVFLSPRIAGRAARNNHLFASKAVDAMALAGLSPAERRVLSYIADYLSNEQIARELFISPKTVENHRTRICHKLGISGHNALLRFALEHRSML
jgi:DNA-binding NarL/FixJ family response regulator